MFFVYVLYSKKDNNLYTGCTNDLERRIKEHQSGHQISTKSRGPFELVYYEYCKEKDDAFARERQLKSGKGKKYLKSRLKTFFENIISNRL